MFENKKSVIMIGTDLRTQGGVSAVVDVLRSAGFFSRCNVEYIATHCDGGRMAKVALAGRAWFRFLWILMWCKAGLVHVHMASRASFWRKSAFVLPSFLFSVPVVIHLHGAEFKVFYGEESSSIVRRFIRFVFENADRVIVLSHGWNDWVSDSFPRSRVCVVYNPVGMIPVSRLERELSIVFLGRIGERKGAYDLISAMAFLVPKFPDVVLYMGGDGDIDGARRLAADLGVLGNVKFLGWVSGSEKLDYLQRAAVYVLPSYNEGLPMSILEAMACGLPVVSTPVGGIPEAITEGLDGFLVQPGDVKMLADRLERLLDDAPLRARMGAEARQKAQETFFVDVIIPQLEDVYAGVLAFRQG